MSGRVIPAPLETGVDFQDLGQSPLFGLLWLASELLCDVSFSMLIN